MRVAVAFIAGVAVGMILASLIIANSVGGTPRVPHCTDELANARLVCWGEPT